MIFIIAGGLVIAALAIASYDIPDEQPKMQNMPLPRYRVRFVDIVAAFLGAAAVLTCLAFMVVTDAFGWEHEFTADMVPPTAQEAIEIQEWIPIQCCRSNNCCFKVPASAVHPISRDEWIVVVSGQKVPRTGWSRDGQTWRCACDPMEGGGWRIHPKAHTRCIFPQATGS